MVLFSLVLPLLLAATPATPEDVFTRLTTAGRWADALDALAKRPADERRLPPARRQAQLCQRRLMQQARQRDPAFQGLRDTLSLSAALAEYGQVLAKLQANYVERAPVSAARLWRAGADELDAALADPTFGATGDVTAFRTRLRTAEPPLTRTDVERLARDFALAAKAELGLNPVAAVLEFACGACNALDEYSAYLPPGQADELAPPGGEGAGLGVQFGFRVGLIVEQVRPGSPAAVAGLRAGDRVTMLNRQALAGRSRAAVAELLRGNASPALELDVTNADGTDPRSARLLLDLPAVTETRLHDGGIGYLRLASFPRTAPQELDDALLTLKMSGAQALVLDLRGNPGGLFTAAVQAAERFLSDGLIVSTRGRVPGASADYHADNAAAFTGPLVLLIDGDTASAAEVLAGALKERGRAVLVGRPTYGKGSVQAVLPFHAIGGVRLTLARFVPPGGQPFEQTGITPHLPVAGAEPQFDAALAKARRLAAGLP